MKKLLVMALAGMLTFSSLPGVTALAAEEAAAVEASAITSSAENADDAALKEDTESEEDAETVAASDTKPMYRLYNPNSGEHFYTASTNERNSLISSGWKYEGVGWVAPASGDPVYRLYNANAGDHHYTTNKAERDNLIRLGWKSEGTGWYSGGSISVYRQYNPNAKSGSHNYTTNKAENDNLVRAGWRGEGIAWKCVEKGYSADQNIDYYKIYHDTLVQVYNEKVKKFSWERESNISRFCTYTLYDITGDGIKDLIISWTLVEADAEAYVYTYNGQTVKQLDTDIYRHEEEIRPAGNAIVYSNVNRGYINIGRVRWNGSTLVHEWLGAKQSLEYTDAWANSVYAAYNCGSPLTFYQATDYSLLRNA